MIVLYCQTWTADYSREPGAAFGYQWFDTSWVGDCSWSSSGQHQVIWSVCPDADH